MTDIGVKAYSEMRHLRGNRRAARVWGWMTHISGGVDTMFISNNFPELGADLIAVLSKIEGENKIGN